MTDKKYAERDAMALDQAGGHYFRHVMAMTAEKLHSKGDIAAELGYRDMQISALQEQVQKLAAENCIQDFIISAVRDLARETDGVSGWHLNGDLATWDEVLPELSHSETPATDAVIREIGAKAVDEVVKFLGGLTSDECGDSAYIGTVNIAAKLRAGEKP